MYSPASISVFKAAKACDEIKLCIVWTGALCVIVIKTVFEVKTTLQ